MAFELHGDLPAEDNGRKTALEDITAETHNHYRLVFNSLFICT